MADRTWADSSTIKEDLSEAGVVTHHANVAPSGDASAAQLVKGDDTRLTNSRTPTAHTHSAGGVVGLATVATSGSYDDLSNKPSVVGQVNADWTSSTDPARILNKPTLGTAAALAAGAANGAATLGSDGKLTSSQVPAAVAASAKGFSSLTWMSGTRASGGTAADLTLDGSEAGGIAAKLAGDSSATRALNISTAAVANWTLGVAIRIRNASSAALVVNPPAGGSLNRADGTSGTGARTIGANSSALLTMDLGVDAWSIEGAVLS